MPPLVAHRGMFDNLLWLQDIGEIKYPEWIKTNNYLGKKISGNTTSGGSPGTNLEDHSS